MGPRAVVIGAGFGGLGVAHALREVGIEDITILERADSVGGVWRDNTYPGAACDIPSQLYSFSFAPNPNWSRSFSPQPEIHAYLQDVAQAAGVLDRTAVVVIADHGMEQTDPENAATWTEALNDTGVAHLDVEGFLYVGQRGSQSE